MISNHGVMLASSWVIHSPQGSCAITKEYSTVTQELWAHFNATPQTLRRSPRVSLSIAWIRRSAPWPSFSTTWIRRSNVWGTRSADQPLASFDSLLGNTPLAIVQCGLITAVKLFQDTTLLILAGKTTGGRSNFKKWWRDFDWFISY